MTQQEKLQRHLTNRDKFIAAIASEVFGPGSVFDLGDMLLAEPTAFDLTKPVVFEKWEDYSKVRPVVDGTGEEILRDERPSSRFGMGILFPELDEAARENIEEQLAVEEIAGTDDVSEAASDEEGLEIRMRFDKEQEARQRKIEIKAERSSKSTDSGPIGEEESDSSSETSDLRLANLRRQRSLGISFVVNAASSGELEFRVRGGRYKRFKDVRIKERKSDRDITWWARRTVDITVPIPFKSLLENDGLPIIKVLEIPSEPGIPDLKLQLEIRVRGRERIPGEDHPVSARLLTVTLVNRGKCTKRDAVDEHCLFQAHLSAEATVGGSSILPYPRHRVVNQGDEQQSLDLLYRHEQTFATGHGCAGAWQADEAAYCAKSVSAEVLPYHESPAITPNLEFVDSKSGEKRELTIPLSLLGDDERVGAALSQLELMVDLYEDWINQRQNDLSKLESTYKAAAQRHVEACKDALKRMRKGIQLLAADSSSDVSVAFRLANQAMLIQALASGAETRVQSFDENEQRASFSPEYHEPDLSSDKASMRAWRPFQIAFLLMNLPALADPSDPGREIVDLIWFPTGGGKTEAYLGCAAFSILMRRIRDPKDIGTHVLMRYTLRLLTAQQFQRASSLICALESLRSGREDLLGKDPFTIGIWVGGDTTPNSRVSAVKALSSTKRNGEEDYKMVILKCPWCGAEMGPKRKPGQQRRYDVHGVRQVGQDVRLHCPDQKCSFSSGLPIKVIDDDLYEEPPTYVIATVDKFASLAWRAECRSLFGIGDDGQRVASPPGLIIQDELHLITGPLGVW
jgi:hypothetical protein